MNTHTIHTIDSAPLDARNALSGLDDAVGFVPYIFGLFANAPIALNAVLELNDAFEHSSFSAAEREIIYLTSSVENRCTYCVAGHSRFALDQGVMPAVVHAIRSGCTAPDTRLEALRHLTTMLVRTRGAISNSTVAAFVNEGFETNQIFEVLIGIAAKTMTNYASKLASLPLDDAFASQAWDPDSVTP